MHETKNYLLEKEKHGYLVSTKLKLIFYHHWLCLNFCFSFFFWCSLGIGISSVGLKTDAIAARIIKYESMIKERTKKHDKIVLLEKRN